MAENGQAGSLAVLIQAGLNMGAVMSRQTSSIAHIAAKGDCPEVLNLLHDVNYPLDLVDSKGNTPLKVALVCDAHKSVDLLMSLGVNFGASNLANKTEFDLLKQCSPKTIFAFVSNACQRAVRACQGQPRGGAAAESQQQLHDLEVMLCWGNFNDLDLHVVTPNSEVINLKNPESTCFGCLDVEQNSAPQHQVAVERVSWSHLPKDGIYHVWVMYTALHHAISNERCKVCRLLWQRAVAT